MSRQLRYRNAGSADTIIIMKTAFTDITVIVTIKISLFLGRNLRHHGPTPYNLDCSAILRTDRVKYLLIKN